jgi:hypothetical protein
MRWTTAAVLVGHTEEAPTTSLPPHLALHVRRQHAILVLLGFTPARPPRPAKVERGASRVHELMAGA